MSRARSAGGPAAAVATVAAGAAASLTFLVPASAAPAPCSVSGDVATVEIGRGEAAKLRVGDAGAIEVDGSPCAAATVDTIATIVAEGGRGAQGLTVDGRGGSFEDAVVDARLGDGKDRVRVLGVPGAERHEVTGAEVNLDPAVGSRVILGSVGRVTVESGKGADVLLGGPRRDVLDGGRGDDRCDGGGSTDALRSCTPAFDGTSSPLSPELRRRMTGRSWHRGCPVGLGKLRLLDVPHWTMGDRDVHRGRLVVHQGADTDVLRAMRGLLQARFPIRRMDLIDRYGGDDRRSMNADNTSAFNCRFVNGTSRWSEHAYGRALDLNPVENPYVTPSGFVSPPKGRPYANRGRRAKGMVHGGDAAQRAFARVGWKWGGNWPGTKDYQHFSASGH